MQWAHYRKSHRYEVRRSRREGVRVYRDVGWGEYDAFLGLYSDTMRRLNAEPRYFFGKEYFDDLRKLLGTRLHLFVAEVGGRVCAASRFVHTNNIIQYHFSATDESFLKLAPSKVDH